VGGIQNSFECAFSKKNSVHCESGFQCVTTAEERCEAVPDVVEAVSDVGNDTVDDEVGSNGDDVDDDIGGDVGAAAPDGNVRSLTDSNWRSSGVL